MARVGKGGISKEEGSFLGEYSEWLTEEKYVLITSFEYSNRESYETWEVLDRETEDLNACGGEQIQRWKRGCFQRLSRDLMNVSIEYNKIGAYY